MDSSSSGVRSTAIAALHLQTDHLYNAGEGGERLAEAERTVPSYLDEILAPLTPDERARLATLVGKLLEF
ncbi:hypothetical protein [Actinomadura litoris]|uniref:hypothetical protein n=1 Tax=Actinomadura litoris TaxID=2678616 RepID=UPI001FA71025|nr:hypothetical protein [Actinomadura litoris]